MEEASLNRAKRARLLADMKISELAQRAGITRATVYALESEDTKHTTSLDTYAKVAAALGVPLSEIVPEERQRELRALINGEEPKGKEEAPTQEGATPEIKQLEMYMSWDSEPGIVHRVILENLEDGTISVKQAEVLLRALESAMKE